MPMGCGHIIKGTTGNHMLSLVYSYMHFLKYPSIFFIQMKISKKEKDKKKILPT